MSLRKATNAILSNWGLVLERSTPAVLGANAMLTVDFDFLMRCEISRRGGNFIFIQIGANDGLSRTDDLVEYVRAFGVSGILVEPQPDVFKDLERNYSNHANIILLQKAVHREQTAMTLYRFDPKMLVDHPNLPVWATTNGIASFSRQHVLDHAKKLRLGPHVIEELVVECISVDDVLALCDGHPDLLKVDVEGYDYEILDALDFGRVHPRIIRFENLHMTEQQYRSIIQKMSAAGYRFLANRMDTTAYSWTDRGLPGTVQTAAND